VSGGPRVVAPRGAEALTRSTGSRPAWLWALAAPWVAGLLLASTGSGCAGAHLAALGVPSVAGDGEAERRRARDELARVGASPGAYATLAAVHLAREELPLARRAARRALVLDPGHVGGLVVAARVDRALGDFVAASRHFDAAVEAAPTLRRLLSREWSETLAEAAAQHIGRGNGEGAEATLTTLAAASPEHATALAARRGELALATAEVWLRQGRADRVEATLALAREAGADAGEVEFAAARAAFSEGEEGSAERIARWASRLASAARWRRVGDFHASRGAHVDAFDAYSQAAALAPDDPTPWVAAGDAAARAQRRDAARAAWASAAAAHARAAEVHAAAGEVEVAVAALLRGAADALERGELDLARGLSGRALALAPAEREAARIQAETLVEGGSEGEAVAALQRHVEAAADPNAAARWAAQALASRGRYAAARALLAALLDGPLASWSLWLERAAVLEAERASVQPGEAGPRDLREGTREGTRDLFEALTRAEELAAGDAAALAAVGQRWLALSGRSEAERLAEAATVAAPESPHGVLLRVDIQRRWRPRADHATSPLDAFEATGPGPRERLAVGAHLARLRDVPAAERWLDAAIASKEPDVVREAHRRLLDLHLDQPRPVPGRVVRHGRAWLEAISAEEREAELERIRGRLTRHPELAGLRIEVLEALAEVRPEDEAIWAELAEALVGARRHREAQRAFEGQMRASSRPEEVAARAAETFRADNQSDETLYFLAMVAPDQLQAVGAHRVAGRLFERRGDWAMAERHYALFVARAPTEGGHWSSSLQAFGERMLDLGHDEVALRALEAAHRGQPRAVAAQLALGRAHLRLGRTGDAAKVFNLYLEGRPAGNRKRLEEVARTYQAEGYLRAAAELLEQRMALDAMPNLGVFQRVVGLYRELGDPVALERVAFELVERVPPTVPRRFYDAAVVSLVDGGADGAAGRVLGHALAGRTHDRALAGRGLALALARGAPGDEVLELALETLRVGGGVLPADQWAATARSLVAHGMPEVASRLLEEGGARLAGEPRVGAALAAARLALGDPEGAHEALVTALAQSPSSGELLAEVERLYGHPIHGARLRDLRRRVVNLDPGRREHRLALGVALLAAGHLDEGRQLLGVLLAEGPRGAQGAARALAAAGLVEEALDAYARAFERTTSESAGDALGGVAGLLAAQGAGHRLDDYVRLYLGVVGAADPGAGPAVASALAAVGRVEDAAEWLARWDRQAPTEEGAWHLAGLRARTRGGAIAASDLHRALGRHVPARRRGASARDVQLEVALAVLLHSGRADEAAAIFGRAAAGRPEDTLLRVARARAQVHAAGAESGLIAAADLPTSLPFAHEPVQRQIVHLARELSARGHHLAAAALLGEAAGPSQRRGWDLLRLTLYAQGGWLEEVPSVAGALVEDGGRGLHDDIGAILGGAGLDPLARPHLEGAVEVLEGARVGPPAERLQRLLVRAGVEPREAARRVVARARLVRERPGDRGLLEGRLRLAAGDLRGALDALLDGLLWVTPREEVAQLAVRASAVLGSSEAVAPVHDALLRQYRDPEKADDTVLAWLEAAHAPALALGVLEDRLTRRPGDGPARLRALGLALEVGDARRASAHADALLATFGDTPEVRLELAERFAAHLFPVEAAAHLGAAAEGGAGAALRAGLLEAHLVALSGRAEEARGACERAVARSPDEVGARVRCAELLVAAGAPAAVAAAVLERVLAQPAPPLAALRVEGLAAWEARDADGARRYVERLRVGLILDPRALPEALSAAARAGDVEGLQALLELTPRWWGGDPGRVSRGLARVAAPGLDPGVVERFEAHLSRVAALLEPTEPAIVEAWAAVARARGGDAAAARVYEAALARRPRSAWNALGLVEHRGSGDPEADLRAVAEIFWRESDPPPLGLAEAPLGDHRMATRVARARILHRAGRNVDALRELDRALHLEGGDRAAVTGAQALRGDVLAALGRRAEAMASYRACARTDPAEPAARRCLTELRAAGALDAKL